MGRNNNDFTFSLLGATHAWVTSPESLQPAISDMTGYKTPETEPARKRLYSPDSSLLREGPNVVNYRRQAADNHSKLLLDAVHTAPKNLDVLYRGVLPGVKHDEAPFSSWSTSEDVAREFAGEKGKVHKAAPGTVQALYIPNQYGEKEFLVKNPKHPYWGKRSA